MKESLGTRIAELRRKKELKQDTLAEALGVSPQAVSKWENDVSCPDIMILPSLARLLGTTVDELLTGKHDDSQTVYLAKEERKDFDQMILRIRIHSTDGDHVNINLPLPLIRVLLKGGVSIESMGGEKMSKANIDWEQILRLVENGVIGKLVEIESGDGDTVEIVVE